MTMVRLQLGCDEVELSKIKQVLDAEGLNMGHFLRTSMRKALAQGVLDFMFGVGSQATSVPNSTPTQPLAKPVPNNTPAIPIANPVPPVKKRPDYVKVLEAQAARDKGLPHDAEIIDAYDNYDGLDIECETKDTRAEWAAYAQEQKTVDFFDSAVSKVTKARMNGEKAWVFATGKQPAFRVITSEDIEGKMKYVSKSGQPVICTSDYTPTELDMLLVNM